jgi:hypothetical protein
MACAHKSTSTLLALALDSKKKVDGMAVATITGVFAPNSRARHYGSGQAIRQYRRSWH